MNSSTQSRGALVALVSGGILFIVMFFFKWFEASASAGGFSISESVNAWHSVEVIRWFLLLTVILAVVAGVLKLTSGRVDNTLATVLTGVAALTTLLVLYRLISTPGPDVSAPGVDVDVSREPGVFLGFIAAAATTYGGYLLMNESDAPRSTPSAPASGGAPPPPPPGGNEPPAGGPPPAQ